MTWLSYAAAAVVFVLIILSPSLPAVYASVDPVVFYAATDGDDSHPGTQDKPFASLERAREAIRQSGAERREGGAVVILRGGRYRRSGTFVLSGQDSGRPGSPVVYKAAPNETVILDGGYLLSAEIFKPVADLQVSRRLPEAVRDRVLCADLRGQGITEYGQFGPRGWGRPQIPAPMELFLDGTPQRIARWPNEGHIPLGKIVQSGAQAEDSPSGSGPGVFGYNTDRAGRWVSAEAPFISGLFGVSWAHDTVGIAKIDTEAGTFTTDSPHSYGFRQPGFLGFQTHYHVVNLLEEIDLPGEYYIDRRNGILYVLPPYPLERSRIQVSLLAEPFIRIENASSIHIEGITFESARGTGLYVQGGQGIRITGCTLRAIGQEGIAINGGREHQVVSCDIYHTGRGGITITGGDRRTLTPADHLVRNCDIHSYNRWIQYYNPAITAAGVGTRLEHNHLHRALHQAITFSGNEHVFEFNEIHHVIKDISDMGSIYIGRNPTFAGNVIRYNFFHHLSDYQTGGPGVQAIFFDDDTLYVAKVFGNVFYRTGSTGVIKFHGGGGASIANNIAIACPKLVQDGPGDKEGIERALRKMRTDQPFQHGFPRMIAEMKIDEPPYRTRYPYLYDTFTDGWNEGTPRWNNYEAGEDVSPFVDPENLNFQLKDDSPILRQVAEHVSDRVYGLSDATMPFERIPFEKIGLYQDAFRSAPGPAAFSKLGPANEAVVHDTDKVCLWWTLSHTADVYRVQIAADAELKQVQVERTVETNYLTLDALEPGRTYYWQVEAQVTQSRSNRGRKSALGGVWHFKTGGGENGNP